MRLGILCLIGTLFSGGILGADPSLRPHYEIKNFRFSPHTSQDFERLVIEFKEKKKGDGVPSVKLVPHPNGKESTVYLENIQLDGAIPEAAINDSYSRKATYLGAIQLSSDDPTAGLTLKVSLKGGTVDAFWMSHPSRLIVDAFSDTSPRRSGPQVLNRNRNTKVARNESAEASRNLASTPVNPASVPEENKNRVICFPASAQMVATISFGDRGVPKVEKDKSATLDAAAMGADQVVCFPMSTERVAVVSFELQGAGTAATAAAAAQPAPPQHQPQQQNFMAPGQLGQAPILQQQQQGYGGIQGMGYGYNPQMQGYGGAMSPYGAPMAGSGGLLNTGPGMPYGQMGGPMRAPASNLPQGLIPNNGQKKSNMPSSLIPGRK